MEEDLIITRDRVTKEIYKVVFGYDILYIKIVFL
jgi:hypothetical protein